MFDEFSLWLQDRFEDLGDAVVVLIMWMTALLWGGLALAGVLYGVVWVIGAVAGWVL